MPLHSLGANVRRYMKIRGLSIPQLAEQAGLSSAGLSNLLNGKADPRSSTLINISKALDVPVGQLVESVPELKSLRFRTKKTLSAREKAERDQLITDTSIWLQAYSFLESELEDRLPYRFAKRRMTDPVKAAAVVRSELDVGPNSPITDIADVIEQAGTKLRIKPFGFRQTNGLSVAEMDRGPAIVVNSESGIPVERQIFTIAHELGHLILHRSSYDGNDNEENKPEENEANMFAGHFLLPTNALKKEWDKESGRNWVKTILHIKKVYRVSYQAVLVRLSQDVLGLDKGRLFQQFAVDFKRLYGRDLKNHFEPEALDSMEPAELMANDNVEADSLSENELVEDRFSRLIRRAYEAEIISLSRAAEMRGCSLEEMRDLVRRWQELGGKETTV